MYLVYTNNFMVNGYLIWNGRNTRYPKVRLSFVRAIHEAQKEIHASVHLGVPTLIMHASQSSVSTPME